MKISISDTIGDACPETVLAVIEAQVLNSASNEILWHKFEDEIQSIKTTLTLEQINKRPEIAATRRVYKLLGKDPNRYRPSAEALCRRICRGIPVYQVNTIVDIINFVSVRTGFSIGGFDLNAIQGDLQLCVGTAEDEFEAIGRGKLNVDGLPLFRDSLGGIGTPTSDNERTKILLNTNHLLMIMNGYSGETGMDNAVKLTHDLLEKYAGLSVFDVKWIRWTNTI
jgi:DNA/RNA-binding domain of Phe-tRNA-synthetase-like protein